MNGHFSMVCSLRESGEWSSRIVSIKSDFCSFHGFNVSRVVHVPAVRFVASSSPRQFDHDHWVACSIKTCGRWRSALHPAHDLVYSVELHFPRIKLGTGADISSFPSRWICSINRSLFQRAIWYLWTMLFNCMHIVFLLPPQHPSFCICLCQSIYSRLSISSRQLR